MSTYIIQMLLIMLVLQEQLEKEILNLIKQFELEPDRIDIWVDKDGDLLIEGAGMQPLDGIELIAHVTNGDVYFK